MNKEVEAYETVDVAEVRKDDEGRFDGYGFLHTHPYTGWDSPGWEWGTIVDLNYCKDAVVVRFGQSLVRLRKSSLKSARRRVEPKPETKECRFPCTHAVCPDCEGKTDKCCWCGKEIAPPAPPEQEAEPEVGSWECRYGETQGFSPCGIKGTCTDTERRVRRSSGWSRDERRGERRKGAPWIIKVHEEVPLEIHCLLGPRIRNRRVSDDRRKATR